MNRIRKLISFLVVLLSWNTAIAHSLDKQIDDFFSQQLVDIADSITIDYPNSKPQLSCDNPTLSLMNKNKLWGNVTISAQCGNKKSFIQLNVAVMGYYIVANQPIAAGTAISDDNVRLQSGRLDTLPQSVILNKEQIINYIALRNINSDQPIKSSMIRKNWLVKAGQSVKVIINGEGYQIVTHGKPLTNAALGENVNVRINSGKIVEGIVTNQGVTIFNKKS